MNTSASWKGLNAYERHKKFVNDFVIHYGKQKQYQSSLTQTKTDHDVLKEEYRFIRTTTDDEKDSWEQRLARKYYEKLFKEYCLADMTYYQKGKIGLRWRTQSEVFSGKGQFVCGNKHCSATNNLKSYEVAFSYVECNEQKTALVKLRVCEDCASKLNYKQLKKEQKKRKQENTLDKTEKNKIQKFDNETISSEPAESNSPVPTPTTTATSTTDSAERESSFWQQKPEIEKTKEEEFEEYFAGLFP